MASGDTQKNHTGSGSEIDIMGAHRVCWTNTTESSAVSAVVTAVAELQDCSPLDLPPLAESIDPEALNGLFSSTTVDSVDRLVFYYCGYEVTVRPTEIQLRTPNGT